MKYEETGDGDVPRLTTLVFLTIPQAPVLHPIPITHGASIQLPTIQLLILKNM